METRIGDILLIHHQNQPAAYARVEEILADIKPGWWSIRLLLLQVPTQEVSWILRQEYIDGGEFTMGGEPMRLERLPAPGASSPEEPEPPKPEKKPETKSDGAKVLSLSDRRKK